MKQKSGLRLFVGLLLAAGVALSFGSARVAGYQDESATGEKNQPKESSSTKGNSDKPASETVTVSPVSSVTRKAQEPKPTTSTWGAYEVSSSLEFGVRGISIDGSSNKFRSDHNYDPGFRLFDGSLMMKSTGPNGILFDDLMVNTFGWSNDPNRYLRADATKTKLYKFAANYRRIDYFNNLTNFAAPGVPSSQHTSNTRLKQGDFDLTLWPAYKKFRLNLGYSLNSNSGDSTTTYRYSSDEFPLFAPIRTSARDYRIGFDSKLSIFDLSFMQGWRFFKNDTKYFVNQQQLGNNPTNNAVLDTYERNVPTRGELPYTRFSVHTFLWKRLDITGRYVYSSGLNDFTYFDNATGINSQGRRIVSDAITVLGNAKRPNHLGDLSATVQVLPWLRISDSFRVQTFRINGDDAFNQVTRLTGIPPVTTTNRNEFQETKYRRFVNLFEGDADLSKRFSFHLGYRYSDRHIELQSQSITVGQPPPPVDQEEFDNRTNAFIFGFKAKPTKTWSIYLDFEKGENDNVFTRTANYDYTNFRVRSIFRLNNNLRFNTSFVTRDNTNPTVLDARDFIAKVDTRIFSGSAEWIVNKDLNVTGGYTYLHLSSDTLVQFVRPVVGGGILQVLPSLYFVRNHFAFGTVYWHPHRRLSVYGTSRIHIDHGQGDLLTTPDQVVNSYPFQQWSPEVKVSVKLHRNLDWIAGYQYFDYKERFANNQFYQTHLPYTSLRVYFGGGN